MNEYEATGPSVNEAVENALAELGIKKENAHIEVKEEPTQGILGIIGNKTARVIVKPLKAPDQYIESYIKDMLSYMNIEGEVKVKEDAEKIKAEIYGKDAGILIGRRGRILSDLQYLMSVIIRRQYSKLKKIIVLDVENYREKREKTLYKLAENVAYKALKDNSEKSLEPMTPQERRIIHLALKDYPGVETYSAGEEPNRKVIVTPNKI
ncbi:MAG: RNA-binding cell elongation regulator Jag/EloR [Bacillota bacterium]